MSLNITVFVLKLHFEIIAHEFSKEMYKMIACLLHNFFSNYIIIKLGNTNIGMYIAVNLRA